MAFTRTLTTVGTTRARTRWFAAVARWIDRHRQRRALAALDDRLLRDIGVTPTAARREANRWFWDCWLDGLPSRDIGVTRPGAKRHISRSFWDY